MKVFKGARTLDELHQAYKKLRMLWHPDHSPFSEKESSDRFIWLKQAYKMIIDNWQKFDPQNLDIPANRVEKLMIQEMRWEADSFWYDRPN